MTSTSPPLLDVRKPGAYAVSSESVGEPKFFTVTVPSGVEPGSTFTFSAGDSRGLSARCPPSAKPGDTLQVAISPQPETHYTPLRMATLTTLQESPTGGAKPMTSQVRQANEEFLQDISDTFVLTVPANVSPGQQFVAQTPKGERFLVTCPPHVKGGQRLRIHAPQNHQLQKQPASIGGSTSSSASASEKTGNTKIFQIKAPEGVRPNQVLRVLVCGRCIPVTLPSDVVAGQTLNLKLPVEQVVNSIELAYDDAASKGWTRTIRMSDLKFQWVNNDITATTAASPSTTNGTHSPELQQQQQQHPWKTKNSAFCRKLTYLEGNDPRMRCGTVELVPANEVVVDSELRHHHRTLVSYATVAHIQNQPLEEKINWFQGLCSILTTPWESGRIKMIIRRDQLLGDSVRSIMALSRADMRKRWRLEFLGEPAIDSGGVMREWFQLVTKQMFNPDLGLWLSSLNNQLCMLINPASDISCPEDHLIYFRFLGRLLGRALFDRQLVHGHMVRHLYKHLLGWPITFEDLQAQDEEYYQSLKKFTEMGDEDISHLCLDFTVAEETLGVRRDVELVPGGKDIEVTKANLPQYMEAILKYRMLGRTKPQITELLLGFFDVIPEPALTVFDPNELELILCGLPTIDIDDWENNTNYSGTCTADDEVVKWFWQIIRDDFDQEMRARLLQFVTGTAGVPSSGFSVLQGNDGSVKKFAVHGVDRATYAFPRAHTCFNRMDLPNYSTKEELYEKLKAAVTYAAVGFDIE